jgi:hypothetical protein
MLPCTPPPALPCALAQPHPDRSGGISFAPQPIEPAAWSCLCRITAPRRVAPIFPSRQAGSGGICHLLYSSNHAIPASRQINYMEVIPPSTGITCPVTNEAASEQSQITASPTSSGSAILCIGITLRVRSLSSGWVRVRFSIKRVRSVGAGHTTFTLMPDVATSRAAAFERPIKPVLLAS